MECLHFFSKLVFICVLRKTNSSYALLSSNISNTRNSASSGNPNTKKRVENTTPSGVFLTKFEVLDSQ